MEKGTVYDRGEDSEGGEKIRGKSGRGRMWGMDDENRREGEKTGGRGGCSMKEGGREGVEGMVERIRDMERKLEWREREKKKRNIVMKGLKVGKGRIEVEIEKVMSNIGVKVRIEEVRRIKTGKEEWGEMVVVKLGSEEKKKKVMEGKKKLRGGGLDNGGFNLGREENEMENKRDSKKRRGERK